MKDQKKHAVEILEKAHMVNCNSNRTPVDSEYKLGADGDSISDSTLYRSLAEPHFSALKRIMWRSTYGYCVFLGNNLLSWSAKRQPTLSRSGAEAEYRCVANVVAETCWLRNLLRELHNPLSFDTLVYCDNVSAVYLSSNPIQHQRTKHIEIKIHFVRDLVAAGQVRVLHVPSRYQFADIFTKGLPSALFEEFRTSLSVSLDDSNGVLYGSSSGTLYQVNLSRPCTRKEDTVSLTVGTDPTIGLRRENPYVM
nr:ribonuclease H-like domain-containing protein [Tanacetum cinerariifolium]